MTDISSVTTIYLLRHGDYENPLNIFHGRLPGFPLSTLGLEQARRLGESMADLPITAVYASPLTRTYQTAQAIANIHHLPVQTDDRLMDLVTPLQGKPISYMESINWSFSDEFIKQGGEKLSQVFSRMDSCIRESGTASGQTYCISLPWGSGHGHQNKISGHGPSQPQGNVSICGSCRRYIIRMDGLGKILSVANFPEQTH